MKKNNKFMEIGLELLDESFINLVLKISPDYSDRVLLPRRSHEIHISHTSFTIHY
jgi:hypothetical protein